MSGKEILNHETVLQFYLKNSLASHSAVAKELNVARLTVGYITRRFRQPKTIERKSRSGKKKGFQNKSKARNIKVSIFKNPMQSLKDLAKKFKCSKSQAHKVL